MKFQDDGSLAKITHRADDCIWLVMRVPNVRRATAYISPKLTVKASAQRRQDKRDKSATILVTIGAPNFVERQFIRTAQKAGEKFPIKKTLLKYWPKK